MYRYGYDGFGNVKTITDPLGGVRTFRIRRVGVQPAVRHQRAGFLSTSFQYDANRRRTRTTHADGTSSRIEYDCCSESAIVDEHSHTTRVYRNSALLPTQTVDAAGNRFSYGYDQALNRTRITDPYGRHQLVRLRQP